MTINYLPRNMLYFIDIYNYLCFYDFPPFEPPPRHPGQHDQPSTVTHIVIHSKISASSPTLQGLQ